MPLTATERTANLRARRKAQGYTILHCQIPPDASSILVGLVKGTGLTKAEIITRLIRSYAEKFG
jgi:hypothetical protein